MHAAYKGKVDMCRLLLRHGADVNCNEHEHGYTALMFAGLSGNLLGNLSHWILWHWCIRFDLISWRKVLTPWYASGLLLFMWLTLVCWESAGKWNRGVAVSFIQHFCLFFLRPVACLCLVLFGHMSKFTLATISVHCRIYCLIIFCYTGKDAAPHCLL